MNAGTVSAMKVATGAMKNQMMDPDEMVDVMDDAREQVRLKSAEELPCRRAHNLNFVILFRFQSLTCTLPALIPPPSFPDGPIRRAERAACGAHDALYGRRRREFAAKCRLRRNISVEGACG